MLKPGTLTLTDNCNNIEGNDSLQDIMTHFATKFDSEIRETFGVKDMNMMSFGIGSHWLHHLGFIISIKFHEDDTILTLYKP